MNSRNDNKRKTKGGRYQLIAVGNDHIVIVDSIPHHGREPVAVTKWHWPIEGEPKDVRVFETETRHEDARTYAETLTDAPLQKMKKPGSPREIEMWIRYGMKFVAVGGKFQVPDHLREYDVCPSCKGWGAKMAVVRRVQK